MRQGVMSNAVVFIPEAAEQLAAIYRYIAAKGDTRFDTARLTNRELSGLSAASTTLPRSRHERTRPQRMNPSAQSSISDADAVATLDALRLLADRPELSQRQLSQALGLSLGKTHYVLHALLDRGLVKIENFRRNDNKLAYAYLLTPKGLKAKLQFTRSFLARKEAEFELLQSTIARLRQEVQHAHASASSDSTP